MLAGEGIRKVERADEPVDLTEVRHEHRVVRVKFTVPRYGRANLPLLDPLGLVEWLVEGPYLRVRCLVDLGCEEGGYLRRSRPVQDAGRHVIVPQDHERDMRVRHGEALALVGERAYVLPE